MDIYHHDRFLWFLGRMLQSILSVHGVLLLITKLFNLGHLQLLILILISPKQLRFQIQIPLTSPTNLSNCGFLAILDLVIVFMILVQNLPVIHFRHYLHDTVSKIHLLQLKIHKQMQIYIAGWCPIIPSGTTKKINIFKGYIQISIFIESIGNG